MYTGKTETFMAAVWCCLFTRIFHICPSWNWKTTRSQFWVELFANKTSHYVASWYRQPGGTSEDIQLFRDQLDHIRNLRKPVRVKIFERKKKVSRYYEMVSRLFEKAPRYFEKLSRYYEKVLRYYEMASRLFEKVPHYFEKVSRYYEMVSRLFEKVPRYFETVFRYYEKFPRYYEMASRLFEKVSRYFEKFSRYYAPNFEEVDRAYWFRVMRASVRLFVQEPCMLGFWNFIYGFLMEKYFTHVFFLVRVTSLSGVMPLSKKSERNLMHAISYEPCMLVFWNSYMDSSWKNSWPVFFPCPRYLPFWRYAPLKKSA